MLSPDSGGQTRRRSRQYHCHSHPRIIALFIFVLALVPLRAQSLLEARVLEGDGQVISPDSRISRPLVVQVTDETGAPVTDALVSFRLPEDGVSGLFRNGLKTEILSTDQDGKVALRSLHTGALAGEFQVRVTVAKGDARTGVISTQFIRPEPRQRGVRAIMPSRRVLGISALVLAGAAIAYTRQRGSSTSTVEPPPSIGPPTISVGKP